jgi:ribonuclease-3
VNASFDELEQRLGVVFRDRGLLELALTHPSWAEEHAAESYQRLEFLGDSVLGFVIADLVYSRYPDRDEGHLTRMKWSLVCGTTLASIGAELALGSYMRLGRGASRDGERASVLEACFEAVCGAVYLDAGMEVSRGFILRCLGDRIDDLATVTDAVRNPKGELQEAAQARNLGLPVYSITSTEGPHHDRRFVAQVALGDLEMGTGTGTSKQTAEADAALAALARLIPKRTKRR